jgi:hypothetical protein
MLSFPATNSLPGIESKTFPRDFGTYLCNILFKTKNFVLCAFPLSCLVSELQKPALPGIELIILLGNIDAPMFSSWSHQIIMLSLVQIVTPAVKVQGNIHVNK